MSFLAGTILINVGDEYLSFAQFANMVSKPLIFGFYSFEMRKINIFYNVFWRLLHEKNPKLGKVFDDFHIEPSVFLFEWVVTLYSNVLPIETSSRIWDNFFFYGEVFLMKIVLGICTCLEKICKDNFETMIVLFK